MKTLILFLTCATLATSSAVRDKRSWSHAAGYSVPVSVHTVVRPSNTVHDAINLVCLNALCSLLALDMGW